MDTVYAIVTVAALLISFAVYRSNDSRNRRLPPGPKRHPLIGNLMDMPRGLAWIQYAKWCRELSSDIIHLSVGGQSIVILDSAEVVHELLEKKSAIYSSRAQLTMLHDLIGWKYTFSFAPYDAIWREQRKIFTKVINPSNPTLFHSKQLAAAHDLLERLAGTSDVMEALHHWSAVLIMDITYGISGDAADPYIATAIQALDSLAIAGTPGEFLVDTIPLLRYVPEWFPGATFKKKARVWYKLRQDMTDKPYLTAKKLIASGTYAPSLVSYALETLDHASDVTMQEDVIKGAAVTSYGGGSDTVVAAMSAFILAMLLHPDIQARAHHELDTALGPDDLPTFDDEFRLPYISALVKEVLRHNPVTPLAIPHYLIDDDTHAGYWLPKGSIVIANAWSILHDEKTYPDPFAFNPGRFLDADGQLDPAVKDPATVSFGFGRRVCPGRHVAIASIWITVASILARYEITRATDSNGKPVEVSGEWYTGSTLFNRPLPFTCAFKRRHSSPMTVA
ncbi:cytochrome P450 [Laetiporus sulphureus 93-53]|uniref:Cytochrome P450 n=1 Tax=Laetiporus sulphureus 93-53 TaxID=1314785 RepID=A0A165DHF7_9APHY|nr:cytochrome P450 [Laetiporus sulphureus 93-53]KZT04887.1 cytochrome P450 [Laetiporus sulphureus 93-53]